MTAIQTAINRNFSIEIDLQITRDGVPMVFHDSTLDRLTEETGRVNSRDRKTLEKIKLKGSDDTIPSFDDLLCEVGGARSPYHRIEAPRCTYRGAGYLSCRKIGELFRIDRSHVVRSGHGGGRQTTRPSSTAWNNRRRDADPVSWWGGDTPIGRFQLRHLLHIPQTKPHFIAFDCRALPALSPLFWGRPFARPILSWTVRSQNEQTRIKKWADQIIFEGFDPEPTADPIG